MTSSALIVADDAMLADLGAYILRREGAEVIIADSKQEALQKLSCRTFDLFIFYPADFDNQWRNFLRLARSGQTAAILVTAGKTSDEAALAAYDGGADDYFPLPSSPTVFLAKVRAWLRRVAPADARTGLRVGPLRLDPVHKRLYAGSSPTVRLSALEYRVLSLLMLHAGQALPAGFILEQVWGCSGKEDAALVKNVIYRLRRKIDSAWDAANNGGNGSGINDAIRIETAEGGYVLRITES